MHIDCVTRRYLIDVPAAVVKPGKSNMGWIGQTKGGKSKHIEVLSMVTIRCHVMRLRRA